MYCGIWALVWLVNGLHYALSQPLISQRIIGRENMERRMTFPLLHDYEYELRRQEPYVPAPEHVDILEVRRSHEGPARGEMWREDVDYEDKLSKYGEAFPPAFPSLTDKKLPPHMNVQRPAGKTHSRAFPAILDKRPAGSLLRRRRPLLSHFLRKSTQVEPFHGRSNDLQDNIEEFRKEILQEVMNMMKSSAAAASQASKLPERRSAFGPTVASPKRKTTAMTTTRSSVTETTAAESITRETVEDSRRSALQVVSDSLSAGATNAIRPRMPMGKSSDLTRVDTKAPSTTENARKYVLTTPPVFKGMALGNSSANSRYMGSVGSSTSSLQGVGIANTTIETHTQATKTSENVSVMKMLSTKTSAGNASDVDASRRSATKTLDDAKKSASLVVGVDSHALPERRGFGNDLGLCNPLPSVASMCRPCPINQKV